MRGGDQQCHRRTRRSVVPMAGSSAPGHHSLLCSISQGVRELPDSSQGSARGAPCFQKRQTLDCPAWIVCSPLGAAAESAAHAIGLVVSVDVLEGCVAAPRTCPPELPAGAVAFQASVAARVDSCRTVRASLDARSARRCWCFGARCCHGLLSFLLPASSMDLLGDPFGSLSSAMFRFSFAVKGHNPGGWPDLG